MKWNGLYYSTLRPITDGQYRFPDYSDPIEKKIKLHEVIGYLSSYAFYLFSIKKNNKGQECLNSIFLLLNANSIFYYCPLDRNVSTIGILIYLVRKFRCKEDIYRILDNTVDVLIGWYRCFHKYPAPTDTIEEAVNIEWELPNNEYQSSGLWGYLLFWISKYGDEALYSKAYSFLKQDLNHVTPNIWILRSNEEEALYNHNAMNMAGESVEIILEEDFSEFQKVMKKIAEVYENEKFSYMEYCFPAIEIIASRYYSTVPWSI